MARTESLAELEIDLGTEARELRFQDPDEPFRILIAGDFSGGVGRNRRPVGIDRDNFDQVLALLAPQLRLGAGAAEMAISFRELDDFHPGRLFQRFAGEMRGLLHHASFQALESVWRGLYFLTRRVRTGERLKIHLMDLPHADLVGSGLGDLGRALDRESWAAIAGLYFFSRDEEETLARIAGMAQDAGAPFIAGIAPEIVELTGAFENLRGSLKAQWIGLALPRFLLRLPYGAFEEMPLPLWGHPALLCACLLAEAFERDGWRMRPAGGEIGGLPKPCVEEFLTEDAAAMLLDRGFMPLASIQGTDRVRLVRFQSVARPNAPLAGKWK